MVNNNYKWENYANYRNNVDRSHTLRLLTVERQTVYRSLMNHLADWLDVCSSFRENF